ncbi:hypothetical protein [Yersinia pseudotuberculosis]|uniref:Uncharacterized protein api29 n=1 Tax=Yersinia pseudotuberculosis TaxID=633 RepID=Q6EVV0_YERPU|nr:hypothetical protein [Yersinia pseudotuberculosis]AYW90850.1 hypothetical protein EGX47_05575 [Yersinia pseudotuberculosis]KGA63362.1 hypothetical protein DJ55_1677 [Yersinia pseudotuberculosis]QES99416.1 hypothetical protein FOB73_14615 [Yersinia pseudotuberculosis]CAF28503.1 hypothetical protein [Yersinia pseudotuberculosis]CFU95190.1 Uncharacterised protein [Yersinia pseudotuberculosis]
MGKKNYVLMKFFQNEDFKTQFLNGKIYCNPAALYRKLEKNGIGDRCESVIFSHYKGSEQFDGIKLTMGLGSEFYKNEMNIYDYDTFIMRQTGETDSWLNCWYLLEVTTTEPTKLIQDLDRMLTEFGEYAILLNMNNFEEFLQRIKKYSTKSVDFCRVTYTDNPLKLNKTHKLSHYSYQNEFRFMFGQCDHRCVKAYDDLIVPGGFRDLVMDGFWLQLDDLEGNCWQRYFK